MAESINIDTDQNQMIEIQPGGPFVSSNIFIRFLYQLAILLKTPFWNYFDDLIASFISYSSPHLNPPIIFCGRNINFSILILKTFIFIILVIISFPFAFLGLLILLPLQTIRPRSYTFLAPYTKLKPKLHTTGSYTEFDSEPPNQDLPLISSSRSSLNMLPGSRSVFTCVTANLCLMPKFVSHINNLHTSVDRGRKIAKFFIDGLSSNLDSPLDGADELADRASLGRNNSCGWSAYRTSTDDLAQDEDELESVSTLWSVTSKEKVVSDVIVSPADFLCLQEVFDVRATSRLLEGLKTRYPYIVHDVSWPLHNKRISLLGSGLAIASRYKFIDIRFKAFKDGHKDDKLACKGLLMTKVYLGKTIMNEEMVGYVANTHLQAWSNDNASKARCKQLESINKWIDEFIKTSNRCENKEKIMFDLVVGDFNFDRISHYDLNEQKSQILQNYRDPCMDENGKLFNWVIGTELVQTRIHDDHIKTPFLLHKMLVSELERSQFVASTQPNKPLPNFATKTCDDGKRKIDYILYRDCPQIKTTVKDFKFYTGLTTLTDHLPIGMTIVCESKRENEIVT